MSDFWHSRAKMAELKLLCMNSYGVDLFRYIAIHIAIAKDMTTQIDGSQPPCLLSRLWVTLCSRGRVKAQQERKAQGSWCGAQG